MDSMNKNYDELSSEEKEALIELCKDDPATFIEIVLGIELLEYQKVYVRETFEVLKKQDKFDWRARYFGERYWRDTLYHSTSRRTWYTRI